MIILACETSTLLGSVAVLKDNKLLSFKESMRQGSHSDVLNIFIEQALKESQIKLSDIDLFATGVGPGSFTGIRISLNTIKTLAYCHNKKIIGIDSLQNLAWLANKNLASIYLNDKNNLITNSPIVAMINAYKNMVYIATYESNFSDLLNTHQLVCLKSPEVVRVQNLSSYITNKSYIVGDGYLTYEKYFTPDVKSNLIRVPELRDEPTALSLAQLALTSASNATHWSQLTPTYLRASEAEENAKGIKYQPLF